MKEIRLKPELETHSQVIFEGRKWYLHEQDKEYILLTKDLSGEGSNICIMRYAFDIISDSPDECTCNPGDDACNVCLEEIDKAIDEGRMDMDIVMSPPAQKECAHDIRVNPVNKKLICVKCNFRPDEPACKHDFTSFIAYEGTGCYLCKHCGAQPTQEEFNEILSNEKPQLKLRVGGVYKARNGVIVKVDADPNPSNFYKFKEINSSLYYGENGKCFDEDREDYRDLIEEVQPELPIQRDMKELDKKVKAYEEKPTVAEKETEIIPLGKHPVRQLNEPILQCQSCFEVNLLSSPWKWCKNHRLIYRDDINPRGACPACLITEPKPPSNPFKGSETVYCYIGSIKPWIGKITQIDGDLLRITLSEHTDNLSTANYGDSILAHYKQCELVNE